MNEVVFTKNNKYQSYREEAAEEFGIHRPTTERNILTAIGKVNKTKKKGDGNEKEKKIRSESKNTSR